MRPTSRREGAFRGAKITSTEAHVLRQRGKNVVVCGPDATANRQRAESLEKHVSKRIKHCGPHPNAGPNVLWHFQPDPRPPEGHTFYETSTRKAL